MGFDCFSYRSNRNNSRFISFCLSGSQILLSLPLIAESGQTLDLAAGENIVIACMTSGTLVGWKGTTITSSTVAWQNTTTPSPFNFPINPQTKTTNAGTIPSLELV